MAPSRLPVVAPIASSGRTRINDPAARGIARNRPTPRSRARDAVHVPEASRTSAVHARKKRPTGTPPPLAPARRRRYSRAVDKAPGSERAMTPTRETAVTPRLAPRRRAPGAPRAILAALVLTLSPLPPASAQDLFAYPAKGQTPEQQRKDTAECHAWAAQQTGFDPSRPPP